MMHCSPMCTCWRVQYDAVPLSSQDLSRFDLRYVPDDQDFSQRQVRETATAVPSGYKPPEVGIAAMLHTKPKLTWDAEDEGRKRMLHKRVSKEELRDDDFKVALAAFEQA